MACPICEKESSRKYRPFWSARCADIDLGRWFTGKYAGASTREDDEDELIRELDDETAKPH